ncbi:MAG: hypothetical protein JNM19_11885 [Chitinophagaceae bacterium]|nr:hypothetical protein [Chitinophagaceae bacterium]
MARGGNQSILNDLRGAIGKQIVVKQYAYGTVVSAYPYMRKLKPTALQQYRQGAFADAVAYAQSIVRNPALKKAYAAKLDKGQRVYNAAIKEYLEKQKQKGK